MGVPFFVYICLTSLLCMGYGFNIDTKYAILKEIANSNAYFGYSVAQHSTEDKTKQILVGAPHANSTSTLLSSFEQTGALYKCPIDLTSQGLVNDCTELPYPDTDSLKSDVVSSHQAILSEDKTDMWLGVNIRSSGEGKNVVACGHRYKVIEKDVNVYGQGVCYFYDSDLNLADDIKGKIPCAGQLLVDGTGSMAGEYGVCAAGMGLSAAENDIVYGIPFAGNGRGAIMWTRPKPFPQDPINFLLDATSKKPVTSTNTYLGASTVIIRNLLNDKMKTVVVGAPRERETGMVVVFRLDQVGAKLVQAPGRKYFGDQFGAGYGSSVAEIDIKNDNHPSMVVGAPFYRSTSGEATNTRNTIGGAVHIYYNYGNGIMGNSSRVIITPGMCPPGRDEQCINAQYGYSIASIGDINGDGYHDLAVGAPFYGRGAVFIYNGKSDGTLISKPSQVIMASDLDAESLTRNISGFGVSLSGGYNVDGQGYADVLVGAHSSSHVVVLRTRPVVTITGSIKLRTKSLNPINPVCLSDPTSKTACIDFSICFRASYSDSANTRRGEAEAIAIKYTLVGDAGYEFATNRRVKFDSPRNGDSVIIANFSTVVNGEERCEDQHKVFIPTIRDILKAVKFEMTYELVMPTETLYKNINTYPIMDEFAQTKPTASIDFERECDTPSCETDLAVRAYFTDRKNVIPAKDSESTGNNEFAFDSNMLKKLDLTVKLNVDSAKDRAYETEVYIQLEKELHYTGAVVANDESTACSAKEGENAVVCIFGKAITRGEEREITLTLNYDDLGSTFSTINITASTTSKDTATANNNAVLKVKVNIVTDLELLGSANVGDSVKYGGGEIKGASAMKNDNEIGDLVQHTYTIINNGAHGFVSRVILVVQWPYEIASTGEYLLYMISFPKRETPPSVQGQCRVGDGRINSLGLKIVDEATIPQNQPPAVRRKRETTKKTAAVKTSKSADGTSQRMADLNCYDKTAKCFNVTCEFLNVGPNNEIKVRLTSRLWNSSLTNQFGNDVDVVQVTSTGYLTIDPAAKVSQTDLTNDATNVTTVAEPDSKLIQEEGKLQIWIIIVAAGAGLVLLIVIILVCWKCGFFKRNRPMTYGVKVEKQKENTAYKQVPQSDPDPMT